MLTPQQIQEVSFEKALFGGYDMDSVDEFLEPLTCSDKLLARSVRISARISFSSFSVCFKI